MMKDGRRRFALLVCVGCTSSALFSSFVACDADPSSPVVTIPDAGSIELPDAATEPTAAKDAGTDAIVDAGKDALITVHADVATDFSGLANPNGAWMYGYSLGDPTAADAGAIVVFSAVASDRPDIPAWYDPENVVFGAPSAWRNDSAAADTSIAPGEFALHPGKAGEYAMARWTAPASGVYAITLQFKTGDTGDTDGLLLHNGVTLVNEASTSTEAVHELEVTVAAGDHLDVAVGSKGDFLFDSTPVRLTIRTVGSEP